MSRERYRWDRAQQKVVQVLDDSPATPQGPMVVKDIAPYKSMVTGEMIGGRRQHREHLRTHNMVEVGNEVVPIRKPTHPSVAPDLKAALQQLRSR